MATAQVLGQLHIGWFKQRQIEPPPWHLGSIREIRQKNNDVFNDVTIWTDPAQADDISLRMYIIAMLLLLKL